MIWVLKRTGSMRRLFWAPKTYVKTDGKKLFMLRLKNLSGHNYVLWLKWYSKLLLWCEILNPLPPSVICWQPLQTFWTQIRPNNLSKCRPDLGPNYVFNTLMVFIPEIIIRKSWFWKQNQHRAKKHAKLSSMHRVKEVTQVNINIFNALGI